MIECSRFINQENSLFCVNLHICCLNCSYRLSCKVSCPVYEGLSKVCSSETKIKYEILEVCKFSKNDEK